MALTPTHTHRAFTRPMLMQGGERKPMLANLMFAMFCVFAIRSIPVAIFGIIFYFLMRAVLRRLANGVDPHATAILNRHLRYKSFYNSHSTPWGLGKPFKRW